MDDVAPEPDPSSRLIEKIRWFVRDHLDEEERVLFGALLAPGIATAYRETSTDVEGFTVVDWAPGAIPEELARRLREQGVRISGIDL